MHYKIQNIERKMACVKANLGFMSKYLQNTEMIYEVILSLKWVMDGRPWMPNGKYVDVFRNHVGAEFFND
jgi:hypothetical protein